jgi:pilus assembly protein CpaF
MKTPAATKFLEHPSLQRIRALMLDPEISEIMINGPAQVYVERAGVMQPVAVQFRDDAELMLVIQALLQPTGREVSTSVPYADFRLPDGTRGNVTIPPLALNGPVITLRKLTRQLTKVGDLIRRGTLSNRMAHFLIAAVRARANIVFAGATGTGKTTTLGIFSQYIPQSERIITIEDTAELQLQQAHVVRLECRRANLEGKGEVTLAELVRNSLRMRPTRIIVGEIRGEEATDMIQAITTGHHGCLAVLHASSPEDTISRLEIMLLSRWQLLPLWAIHRQIASAIDLVVQHEMLPDGARKVTRITELAGVQDNQVVLRDLYQYRRAGEGDEWFCSGGMPRILGKCERMGIVVAPEVYAEGSA